MKPFSLTWRSLRTENKVCWRLTCLLLGWLSLAICLALHVCHVTFLHCGQLRWLLVAADLIWGASRLRELGKIKFHQVLYQVIHLILVIFKSLCVNYILLFEVCQKLAEILEYFFVDPLLLSGVRGIFSPPSDVLSDVLYDLVLGILVRMETLPFLRFCESLMQIKRVSLALLDRCRRKGLILHILLVVICRLYEVLRRRAQAFLWVVLVRGVEEIWSHCRRSQLEVLGIAELVRATIMQGIFRYRFSAIWGGLETACPLLLIVRREFYRAWMNNQTLLRIRWSRRILRFRKVDTLMIIWSTLHKIVLQRYMLDVRRSICCRKVLIDRLRFLLTNNTSCAICHHNFTIVYSIVSGVRGRHLACRSGLICVHFVSCARCHLLLLIMAILFLEVLDLLQYLTRALEDCRLHQTWASAERSALILRFLGANHGRVLLLSWNSHLILLNNALCKIRPRLITLSLNRRRRVLRRHYFDVLLGDLLGTQSGWHIIDWGLPTVIGWLLLRQNGYRGCRLGWFSMSLARAMGWIRPDSRVFWILTRPHSSWGHWHMSWLLLLGWLGDAHIARWGLVWQWGISCPLVHRLHATWCKLLFQSDNLLLLLGTLR